MARVLMVDDDEMERIYAAEVLRWGGHDPIFASDGETALRLFEENTIDVVVTDLAMPRLNGIALIRELRRRDGNTRIIAVSGLTAQHLLEARDAGAEAALPKPWTPSDLVAAIDRVLHRPDRAEAGNDDPSPTE